jgi:AraC-like DNA-binding protein
LARIPAAGRQLAEPPPPRIPLAQRADDWLAGHFQGKATLRAAAQALGASVPTLVAALRRHGGGTFHQRLISRRLDHAKQLLASTDQPLHAVARECGFADQSHLVRVFRDQINLTPGQFRALLDWDERQLAAAPPSAGAAAEE